METLHTISKETGDMHKTPGFMGFMKKIKDGVFRAMNEGKKEGIFQSMSSEQKMP
jgi:hypothetical protein